MSYVEVDHSRRIDRAVRGVGRGVDGCRGDALRRPEQARLLRDDRGGTWSAGATTIEGGGPVITIGDGTAGLTVAIRRVTISGGVNDSQPESQFGPGFFAAGGYTSTTGRLARTAGRARSRRRPRPSCRSRSRRLAGEY